MEIEDFLRESLWDRKIVNLKQAWELLETHPNSQSNRFGEPTIKVPLHLVILLHSVKSIPVFFLGKLPTHQCYPKRRGKISVVICMF